jgi:hypothetical protein
MTKRHFIALAQAIKEENNRCRFYGKPEAFGHDALLTLSSFCLRQNPAFNSTRWLDYIAGKCGPNGGTRKCTPSIPQPDETSIQ